jgi:predicted amino acid racemase
MTAPRLNIDLDKIYHNAHTLVELLANRGISVTGVTKAVLGLPKIVDVLLLAGVQAIGDSRIENIEAMRLEGLPVAMSLIRSPMLSQTDRVATHADTSYNTELDVIRKLSYYGQKAGRKHGIVLMVELGDLREGIMPEHLLNTVGETLRLPNVKFKGIGTNLACRSGVSPDADKMSQLSALAVSIETTFDLTVDIVSGGNSANLPWVLSGAEIGRVNELRLGESILLGCEPVHRQPIDGLHTDAITLSAEVIESKVKPSKAWGEVGQTAFGERLPTQDRGRISQTILAIGQQDTDPDGLRSPCGIDVLGASSDHLILESNHCLTIGAEITFQLNYGALVRAMTSPFVAKVVKPQCDTSSRTVEANND